MKKENSHQEKLFSITKKDLVIEYYAASCGAGGQKLNKTNSAVRISHPASKATGQSHSHRSQEQNRKEALKRLVASKEFQTWLRMEVAAVLQGYRGVEEKVDDLMKEKNLKVEVYKEGKWRKGNETTKE